MSHPINNFADCCWLLAASALMIFLITLHRADFDATQQSYRRRRLFLYQQRQQCYYCVTWCTYSIFTNRSRLPSNRKLVYYWLNVKTTFLFFFFRRRFKAVAWVGPDVTWRRFYFRVAKDVIAYSLTTRLLRLLSLAGDSSSSSNETKRNDREKEDWRNQQLALHGELQMWRSFAYVQSVCCCWKVKINFLFTGDDPDDILITQQ